MKRATVIIFLLSILLNSCGGDKDYIITISTSYGDMKVILYDETPVHKENFLSLAKSGAYDSTIFHRIIKEFMVQGGDVTKKKDFQGNAGKKLPAEFVSKYFHKKGALAAARLGDPVNPQKESSFCQFYVVQGKVWSDEEIEQLKVDQKELQEQLGRLFRMPGYDSIYNALVTFYQNGDMANYTKGCIDLVPEIKEKLGIDVTKKIDPVRMETYKTLGGAPHLDDEYTVFGEVVEGVEVIDKLAAVETSRGDVPVDPIYMKVAVEELPRKKIEKLYGFEYANKEK